MKKFFVLVLVMMMVMTGFTACGSADNTEVETPDANTEVNTDIETETEDESLEVDAETDEDAEQEEETVKEETSDKKEESKPAEDKKPAADKKEESKPAENKKPAEEEQEDSITVDEEEVMFEQSAAAALIDQIYTHKTVELPLGTIDVDLADPDALKMFTGLSSADKIASAAASESMMGAQAYSLVAVKVKDAADAAAVAQEMLSGIDPRKWICVEADDLRVAAAGDTVVLMMVSSVHADMVTAADMIEAFRAVAGGLDLELTR